MTKDEALDLALDALEMSDTCADDCKCSRKQAITAIKQARSAPVQEPVADAMARYLRVCSSGGMPKKLRESVQNLVYDAARLGYFKAATPPAAQRQWVGLTAGERDALFTEHYQWDAYGKAIEAKLHEKNNR